MEPFFGQQYIPNPALSDQEIHFNTAIGQLYIRAAREFPFTICRTGWYLGAPHYTIETICKHEFSMDQDWIGTFFLPVDVQTLLSKI